MKISPFKLERFFDRYEFTAKYLLCASDCETFSVQELLDLGNNAEQELSRLRLGYTESKGNSALRQEIAQLYEYISGEDILVHAGAEEAIFVFMNALLSPQDHVLVHFPCYQSLLEIPTAIGCSITKWPADETNNWRLDLDFLKRHIRQNTKAVILNCPHNPTGTIMEQDDFGELISLVEEHNLLLFSDEVYRLLEFDAADRLPAACDCSERAVSLGVMSKSFGLAGLRIGWVATKNLEILQKMAAFKDYLSICNSAPGELLAALALRSANFILARNRKIILNNLSLLKNFMGTHKIFLRWNQPKGGTIAFPCLADEIDSQKFYPDLLQKKEVLLAPGENFYFDNRHFRIGFGRKDFAVGLQKLAEHLENLM